MDFLNYLLPRLLIITGAAFYRWAPNGPHGWYSNCIIAAVCMSTACRWIEHNARPEPSKDGEPTP